MFTYYLCDDGDTIYRIWFSLPKEKRNYYFSLLQKYLEELVFTGEQTRKNLVTKEKMSKEIEDEICVFDYQITLQRKERKVLEELESDLPLVVEENTKSYSFLRPYTIRMLIMLFLKEVENAEPNSMMYRIMHKLGYSKSFDFCFLYTTFFDEAGSLIPANSYDFVAFKQIFEDLNISIDNTYSSNALACFYGDEADTEVAEGILRKSLENRELIAKMNLQSFKKLMG